MKSNLIKIEGRDPGCEGWKYRGVIIDRVCDPTPKRQAVFAVGTVMFAESPEEAARQIDAVIAASCWIVAKEEAAKKGLWTLEDA